MKCNVGGYERWVRVSVGFVITFFAFWGPKTPWALIGLLPLLTGLFRWCPISALLGINTCKNVPTSEEVE